MGEAARIWLTRPRDDSEVFAAALLSHHIESHIAPVMRIEPTLALLEENKKPAALLLTSRHAAHGLASLPAPWRGLPVYCVGEATAAAVTAAGFTRAIAGTGDVLGLLPRVAQDINIGGHVLYFSGEETRADIPTLLGAQGILVQQVVAYRALGAAALKAATIAALRHGALHGVAFFSARSAAIAQQLIAQHGLQTEAAKLRVYCLSLAVAEAAAGLGGAQLLSAYQPTAAAMCDLIVSNARETMV